MLTGEYLVLKGAQALALPVRFGQGMNVESNSSNRIHWTSTIKNEPWAEVVFSLSGIEVLSSNNKLVAQRLQQVLIAAQRLNSSFLSSDQGVSVHSNIDFDIEWGLGSSSTLVSNISQWADCDAFELNRLTFGGSGYDIACARANAPVLFQLKDNKPIYSEVAFNPPFKHQLYFVWLNRKQNTRDGIAAFNKQAAYESEVAQLNEISQQMLTCTDFGAFMGLIQEHEHIISKVINIEPVQQRMFPDFPGKIKSLGAWGGDFVLAASASGDENVKHFFKERGFCTIFRFSEIILSNV
ncbi:MAG: hypothetical protein K9G70_01075 [Prolixibacteraceae bacterium]|nr:hypothetical protein [Prolixibacteraceae bacterium]